MTARICTAARRTGLVLAVAVTGLVAQPAVGAASQAPAPTGGPGDVVELSQDGTTWSKDLAVDLFPGMKWVPGSVGTTTLYVRSRACAQATAQAQVVVGLDDTQRAPDLDVRTRVDSGVWSGPTTPTFTLTAGQVATLDIELGHYRHSGNYSQARTAPVRVTVDVACDVPLALAQSGPSAVTAGGPGSKAGILPPALAGTGLDLVHGAAVAVAAALVGAVLVATRRRGMRDA